MSPDRNPESRFLAPSARAAQRGARSVRGFTLIELMVTVVIIAIIAALATPGILARVNGYKARSAAELVASTYRLARLRAMGRGSAVVVRFNAGVVTVLEGIQGSLSAANAGCEQLPAASCTTPADRFDTGKEGVSYQVVETYDAQGTSYAVTSSLGALSDICFTPLGRAYSRTSLTGIFAPLLTPTTVAVSPGAGGLTRQVVVLPSGTARVIAGAL
jgi:prepilin-type N-terminal cleavage/methylation domain-containing protein